MPPDYRTLGYRAAEHPQAELLATIRGCRHLAGHKLAADAMRKRISAKVAVWRHLAANKAEPAWRPSLAAMRRRLGKVLVAAGTRVGGANPGAEVNTPRTGYSTPF